MHLRFNNQKGKLQILFKAAEMQKNFNAPYQAASMSPGDDPRSGMKETHNVENRDVVVTGSDGLFDNLYPDQVIACFNDQLDSEGTRLVKDLKAVSLCMAKEASKFGADKKWFSPFAKNAREAGIEYMGGKIDDITVIVSEIVLV